MTESDSPLKVLVRRFIKDFARWLLDREIIDAQELSVELPGEPVLLDQLFEISLESSQRCLLHIEFQGRSSRPQMPLRQLNYLSRLAIKYQFPHALESFVIYIGRNAGGQDMGSYNVKHLDGKPCLAWSYSPIHLWKINAEKILEMRSPGILPLAALMKIGDPQQTANKIAEIVNTVADEEDRSIIWMNTLAMMTDKECLAMLEKIVESDDIFADSIYLQRIREAAHKDGFLEGEIHGIQQGVQQGIQQGVQQGIQQGVQQGVQQGIQQGVQQGRVDGLLEGIAIAMEAKFGSAGLKLLPEIRKIKDADVLRTIVDGLRTFDNLDELRSLYREFLPK